MDNLESLLSCTICEEIFDKPTILGCSHTYCSTCISGCELCPQCGESRSRWRRKIKSKIKVMVKWHDGDDIVESFRHDRKDTDNIISTLKTNLICAVCCGLFFKATVTICGHVYCKRCLDSWTSRQMDCPVCRTECTSDSPSSPFPWPLGDRLTEELRRFSKRSRPDDSDLEDEVQSLNPLKRPRYAAAGFGVLATLIVGLLATIQFTPWSM